MDIDRYIFLPEDQATSPPTVSGVYRYFANSWWLVHPELGLAFYKGQRRDASFDWPQCNSDERVARLVHRSTSKIWPCELKFIPSAWVPYTHCP